MNQQEAQPVEQEFFLLDQPQQEMISSLEKFFSELLTGHTSYQIKNFIIGQFHTPDRKHRQALRELYARYTGLIQQHYEARKLQIDIGRSEIALKQTQDKLHILCPSMTVCWWCLAIAPGHTVTWRYRAALFTTIHCLSG